MPEITTEIPFCILVSNEISHQYYDPALPPLSPVDDAGATYFSHYRIEGDRLIVEGAKWENGTFSIWNYPLSICTIHTFADPRPE